MGGLLDFLSPSGGLGAQGGFTDRAASFREQNPGALTALGAGIMNRDIGQGFANAAPLIAQGKQRNMTAQLLLKKGIAKDQEEALALAQNPQLITAFMKGDSLINAGNGQLYNKDTGEWITAPGGGPEAKAPQISELFDANGNAYKAQWNAGTGSWDKLGGVKMTRDKVDEYTRKNRSLATVVAPEVKNLLGDGVTPGKFDALASAKDQYLETGGNAVKSWTGLDVSNYATGADYQSAKNSLKTIVASYLYSVSGATANPGEVETQTTVLMPRPGEDPGSVADKKRRIQTMADAVKQAAAGGGAEGQNPQGMDGTTVPPPAGDPSDPLGLRGP